MNCATTSSVSHVTQSTWSRFTSRLFEQCIVMSQGPLYLVTPFWQKIFLVEKSLKSPEWRIDMNHLNFSHLCTTPNRGARDARKLHSWTIWPQKHITQAYFLTTPQNSITFVFSLFSLSQKQKQNIYLWNEIFLCSIKFSDKIAVFYSSKLHVSFTHVWPDYRRSGSTHKSSGGTLLSTFLNMIRILGWVVEWAAWR